MKTTADFQSTGATTDRNNKSSTNEKKENNFTFLTLLYCAKLLVGNFIDSFSLILNIFQVDIYVKYGFINIVGNSLFFASHGLSFFLYYFFYNVFKRKFLELFCFQKRDWNFIVALKNTFTRNLTLKPN